MPATSSHGTPTSEVEQTDLSLQCSKNVLVIRGRVPTFYLKQLLQDALKQVDGVRRIDNRVEVVAFEGLSSVHQR